MQSPITTATDRSKHRRRRWASLPLGVLALAIVALTLFSGAEPAAALTLFPGSEPAPAPASQIGNVVVEAGPFDVTVRFDERNSSGGSAVGSYHVYVAKTTESYSANSRILKAHDGRKVELFDHQGASRGLRGAYRQKVRFYGLAGNTAYKFRVVALTQGLNPTEIAASAVEVRTTTGGETLWNTWLARVEQLERAACAGRSETNCQIVFLTGDSGVVFNRDEAVKYTPILVPRYGLLNYGQGGSDVANSAQPHAETCIYSAAKEMNGVAVAGNDTTIFTSTGTYKGQAFNIRVSVNPWDLSPTANPVIKTSPPDQFIRGTVSTTASGDLQGRQFFNGPCGDMPANNRNLSGPKGPENGSKTTLEVTNAYLLQQAKTPIGLGGVGAFGDSAPTHPVFDDYAEGDTAQLELHEDSPAGTLVGEPFAATDPNGDSNSLMWFLDPADPDSAAFAIDEGTGQLSVADGVSFDAATKSSYEFTVIVADDEMEMTGLDVIVTITDNASPVFDASLVTALTVAENSPAGTNVGSPITATDPDTDDTLTYSLSGDDAASFTIGGSTGQIATKTGVDYDYEVRSYLPEPAYSLTVNVDDGNGGTASLAVTVTLTDVSDSPAENVAPAFHDGVSATRTVAEDSPAGTNVGKPVTAYDLNGDALTYTGLEGADGQHFNLDSTGQLTTKAGVTYDYDTKSTYTFKLNVRESNTVDLHTSSIDVTVNLTEAVEEEDTTDTGTTDTTTDTAPTVADTSKFKTHYATVGQAFSLVLPAADADSGDGGPYAYSLLKRSDATAFGANGLSFAATTRTLSGTPTAEATHELAYHIHDSDANTAKTDAFVEETKLKIVVLPGGGVVGNTGPQQSNTEPANRAPVFDSGIATTLKVDENSPAGTNVGSAITATDPDAGDTVTYSLTGTDAASFAIGSSTGQITTIANVTYDFETKSSYTLAVDVSDGKGGTDSTPVTINLNDVNETPAFASDADTTLAVDENSAAATNVGDAITATDPDKDATLTYSLTGTDAASFAIGGSTGQITTIANVDYDYEAKSSYSLTVDVSDGKLTDSIDVTVSLNNVNEAPSLADGTVTALSVDENSAAGTKVGSVFTATDPDASDTLAYSLTGTDAASFVIGALTGQIATKSGVAYNHEAKSSYSLTVVATDAGGLTDSVAVTVSLNDVAEAPTVPNTGQFKNHAAKVGQTFSLTLPAADANSGDGGPYEYLLWHRGHGRNFMDQAINGLSFNAATRTLSGTPTAAGVWQLSYVVHDNDTDRSVGDRFRARTNLQITVSQ